MSVAWFLHRKAAHQSLYCNWNLDLFDLGEIDFDLKGHDWKTGVLHLKPLQDVFGCNSANTLDRCHEAVPDFASRLKGL